MSWSDVVGWVSSLLLFATISSQVFEQWRRETSEGVTPLLFIGQAAASTGFLVYSWAIESWVFVATNALMLISALVGLGVLVHHRRCAPSTSDEVTPSPRPLGSTTTSGRRDPAKVRVTAAGSTR